MEISPAPIAHPTESGALPQDDATITGAQALVEELIELGVDTVFGYPGGAIMPTYDALFGASNQLRHILVRHEQGAAHAAQGYARASGKVGVCLATSGPGATNLLTGIADAQMDSTPLVCVSGQVYSHLLGTDAFQESDVVGMSLPVTKWSYQITDPREIRPVLRLAFEIARDGRPGPVFIDFARDAQMARFDGTETREPAALETWGNGYAAQVRDTSAIQEAAALLNQAQRPMMFIGQGVLLSGAESEVDALARRTGIPVASTLLGLSAIPTDHPNYIGMLGMHGHYAPNMLTNEADVILAVGMRFDDRVTGRVADYAKRAKIIHIEIDAAQVDQCVPVEVALIGDAAEVLNELLPHLQPVSCQAWWRRFEELHRQEVEAVIEPALFPPDESMVMGVVVRAISDATDGEAVLVSDVGQHQMFVARYYEFARSQSHITSGGLGTMGFALPAAMGACSSGATRPVIAVAGDGGFQMNVQELGTVAAEQLPVKMVVLNNQYLGMVRQWQELFFEQRYSFVDMTTPDFPMLARSYGIAGETVEDRNDMKAAIERMLDYPGPYLLEVRVAAEENVFPMIPAGAAVDEIRLA